MKGNHLKSFDFYYFVCLSIREEFVDLYIDYVINKSVEKQFNGFHTGFMRVCGGPVMELFRSHELMAVVIGNESYDWDALEQNAKYENGYKSSCQTVRKYSNILSTINLNVNFIHFRFAGSGKFFMSLHWLIKRNFFSS